MDYIALKAELDAGHPDTGAYNVDAGLVGDKSGQINVVNRTRQRDFVTGSEILNATDDAEFSALTDAQKDRWLSMCGIDQIDTSSGIAKSLEAALFGGGTTTRANLIALKIEAVSRAVELSLGFVTAGDVEFARRP